MLFAERLVVVVVLIIAVVLIGVSLWMSAG